MGKLGSIVKTYLVVLSSRVNYGNNCLSRQIPQWTVMGTTDRRECLIPKHLDSENLGTENNSLNFATKWQDGLS